MRLDEAKRDRYRRQALIKGYRSRAAFKLIQIDGEYHILAHGMSVIDIGCYPGGWLQVASQKVGPQGLVVGVDLREVLPLGDNVRIFRGDVTDRNFTEEMLEAGDKVDIVLSDLSPNVSGIWELDHARQIDMTLNVMQLLPRLLKDGGTALLKVFEGDLLKSVWNEAKIDFESLKYVKPKASRAKSSELYLLCRNFLTN